MIGTVLVAAFARICRIMTWRSRFTSQLAYVFVGGAAFAGPISLPEIFDDHMVLQQAKPVPVWGTADAGQQVVVTFGDQKKNAVADATGKWQVTLDAMLASPESRELRVHAESTHPLILKDVLVGEVWLCSGQSNMFWPLGAITNQRTRWPGVHNGEQEVAKAEWPSIRLNCARDHELGLGGWRVCTPNNARGFSATAYFFGRELHRQLGVPIGLIHRSLGGTSLQAWTPAPELEGLPVIQTNTRLFEASKRTIQEWNRNFAAYRKRMREGTQPKPQRPARLPEELEVASKLQNHGTLHERYVVPIAPYALRGNIWYQGESNANPRALAEAYAEMLEALIAGRRRLWADPQLPFYFVQLPLFKNATTGTHWHIVRESMRRVVDRTPQVGMIVTYDFCDPTNLHPPEKQEVGRRLGLLALAKTYQKPLAFSGPLLREVIYREDAAIVAFDYADGLQSQDGKPLRGFELAGEDGRFQKATAAIDGQTVVVKSESIALPKQVRFFYGGFEAPNLVNAARLPASPFTTTESY